MDIAENEVNLTGITVFATRAELLVDGELPAWAPPEGALAASFDPAIFAKSAHVRVQLRTTSEDGGFAVQIDALCEFNLALANGAFAKDWPEGGEREFIDAIWPHVRGPMQAAAFTVDRSLSLNPLAPGH